MAVVEEEMVVNFNGRAVATGRAHVSEDAKKQLNASAGVIA
jgi:archaeosine-15-forming tRNA-guanine transglycosylase